VAGSCEHGNEPSGFIKDAEFDKLNDCQLLNKDPAPWGMLLTRVFLFGNCNSGDIFAIQFPSFFTIQEHYKNTEICISESCKFKETKNVMFTTYALLNSVHIISISIKVHFEVWLISYLTRGCEPHLMDRSFLKLSIRQCCPCA